MTIRLLILTLAIFLFSCTGETEKSPDPVVICFTGDILLDRGVREFIEHRGIDAIFDSLTDKVFRESDLIAGNLECPATLRESPLNKRYIFRAEPEWLKALQEHGFTHLNLANNHAMDQGREGLADTDRNIRLSGMVPLGFGLNERKACKPYILASTPRKVFLISSVLVKSENWTYLPDRACVCEAPIPEITKTVSSLRGREEDALIIVQLHWGREHATMSETMQKHQARELIDAGADCILGHHPHTIQETEYYKGKPVFYSLGNFIFDQREPVNSIGLVVRMTIGKDTVEYDEFRVISNPALR
ncbi:MAG: CapA family protein [Bacteroidales bacterium]|nr:CapA family protein [Bacteroidales bacterium]